jgi:hypothetical protein
VEHNWSQCSPALGSFVKSVSSLSNELIQSNSVQSGRGPAPALALLNLKNQRGQAAS